MIQSLDRRQCHAVWIDAGDGRVTAAETERSVKILRHRAVVAELLRVLPELGPVFSGFARYLATRADRESSTTRVTARNEYEAVEAASQSGMQDGNQYPWIGEQPAVAVDA